MPWGISKLLNFPYIRNPLQQTAVVVLPLRPRSGFKCAVIIYKTCPYRNEIIVSGQEARKGRVCEENGQIPC